MSINGKTLDLVLEVISTTEGMFSIGKHLYFTYITNLKGLEEFIGKYTRRPFPSGRSSSRSESIRSQNREHAQ